MLVSNIDIQYHFVHEAVDCHLVNFEFISIIKQAADGLTKALSAVKFSCFFLFSQVLYLINDLSSTHSNLIVVDLLCHLLHSHFLTLLLQPSSHSHHLTVELTFLVRLDFILVSE
jgi:hypothetical protein